MAKVAKGTIKQLWAGTDVLKIQFHKMPKTKGGVFNLPINHANYATVSALALTAFANGCLVRIGTEGDITPDRVSKVSYLRIFMS